MVAKPVGVGMHQEEGEPGFIQRLQEAMGSAEKLYPVHRLDKITSGLLLVARNKAAAAEFGEIFARRDIEKIYLAVSNKKPKKKQGAIIGKMVKARNGSWRLSSIKSTSFQASPEPTNHQESPAKTQFFSKSIGAGCRVFIVKPHTGKTHQIRVALKSLGAPITGDDRYGGVDSDRAYLHAYGLKFTFKDKVFCFLHAPDDGKVFNSAEFVETLKETGNPFDLDWPKI